MVSASELNFAPSILRPLFQKKGMKPKAREVFLRITEYSSEQKEDLDELISLLDGFLPHRSKFRPSTDLSIFCAAKAPFESISLLLWFPRIPKSVLPEEGAKRQLPITFLEEGGRRFGYGKDS